MDVVGSEIGHKMRSAIKAKLTELGCYVDDELPDYVMVMVANKRTRAQMEDDLQLFLGDNTELFVNWLHQVLKKLQEVTVAAPVLKAAERDKSKERSKSKDRKEKKSKDKHKKSDMKKSKKKDKDKEKTLRKKDDKKIHKTKKKSKHHEMIRPNVPPLLMNMEKESEPSITDVFAGQILKNHGISLDSPKEEAKQEDKPIILEIKRPIVPIIDPAGIPSQPESDTNKIPEGGNEESSDPKEDQIEELNQIEAKIQGFKQKLAEQLDSMSDDEDFLNIRTEAEELMNDFAEDVFQEISQQTPVVSTPPIQASKTSNPPPPSIPKPIEVPKEALKDPVEALPQIELKLPKRPVRERLGARETLKKQTEAKEKERTETPERFTPDREPEQRVQKSAKSRLGDLIEANKRSSLCDDANSDKSSDSNNKKLTSRVSVLENRPSRSCASVVRVRPRPRASAPSSSLLLRAVADAHKSLLNTPTTKVDKETQQIKRALVLPMRRCVEAQKILIQVPTDNSQEAGDSISLGGDMDSDDDKSEKLANDLDKEEFKPKPLTKKIINNEYQASMRNEGRTTNRTDDSLIVETINIHNTSTGKDKSTQFIVTMDGYHPNAFLAKKLETEGLLNDEDEISKSVKEKLLSPEIQDPKPKEKEVLKTPEKVLESQTKRLSNTSEESETQVIIKKEDEQPDKRKSIELKNDLPVLKRKASPIVFDVVKKAKEIEKVRERTESVSSDSNVTVTTVTSTHKYDAVPPLSAAERKLVWCRLFPACRYGAACAFLHPRCKFLAGCTRRNCAYSHSPLAPPGPPPVQLAAVPLAPSVDESVKVLNFEVLPAHANLTCQLMHLLNNEQGSIVDALLGLQASHVVPAANYKTISAVVPNMCKFYPNCVNPACHFYHPKPCRYGNNCANKLECNFYHADVPPKWRYPV